MRILVFGDSITQGFHDAEAGGWCNRLLRDVMETEVASDYEYNKSIVNLGISGDTTGDVANRVRSETEARVLKYPTSDYDVVVLAIGVNDSQFTMASHEDKIPLETTLNNIEKIYSEIEDLVQSVVIVGIASVVDERIQPMSWKPTHGYSNENIARYNQAIAELAQTKGSLYIDLDNVYDETEQCLPDGIHPNARGHEQIYQRVKGVLEAEGIL